MTACTQNVTVKVQRLVSGTWKTLASVTTDGSGAYKAKLADKPGKYRSLAPKVTLQGGDICAKDVSPVERND